MDSAELTRHYDFSGKTVVVTGGTGTLGVKLPALWWAAAPTWPSWTATWGLPSAFWT